MNITKLFTTVCFILGISFSVTSQRLTIGKKLYWGNKPLNYTMLQAVIDFQGKKVLKIERDLKSLPFDIII